MKITAISDLHGHYPQLPGGDLLIVAGDLTRSDGFLENVQSLDWICNQKYRKKILIAGNHDNILQQMAAPDMEQNKTFFIDIQYLCDSGCEYEGLKIWGSPWTSQFPGINPKCCAFTCDTDEQLAEKWALIPDDIDILVTHEPPYEILDRNRHEIPCGSLSLRNAVLDGHRFKNLKFHIFGHIHERGGQFKTSLIQFINCSHVNEHYEPVNAPMEIEL